MVMQSDTLEHVVNDMDLLRQVEILPDITVKLANGTTKRSTHKEVVDKKLGNNQSALCKAYYIPSLSLIWIPSSRSDDYGVTTIIDRCQCTWNDRDADEKLLGVVTKRKRDEPSLSRLILPGGECWVILPVLESCRREQHKSTDSRFTERAGVYGIKDLPIKYDNNKRDYKVQQTWDEQRR